MVTSEETMATESVLQQLVEQNLSLFLYDNAKFYAERLYYERKTQANLHILAQCYFREGKTKQAYLVLQGHNNSAENRYLLAQCCLALDKLDEGERTLLASVPKEGVSLISVIPGGAAGLYLLGLICKRGHRRESAIRYFTLSLEADRTNWGAIMQLSDLGEAIDITKVYGVSVPEAVETLRGADIMGGVDSTGEYHGDEGDGNDGDDSKGLGGKQQGLVLFGKTNFGTAGAAGAAGGDGVANDENSSNQKSNHLHLDRSVLNSSQTRLGSGDSTMMGADTTRMSRGGTMFDAEVGSEEQTTLHDRQVAESTSGIAFNSPNVSMSLGMSSSSLNIPFASPGSVPRNDFLHYLRGTNKIVPSSASAADHSITMHMNMTGFSGHSGPTGESGTDALAAIRGGRDSTGAGAGAGTGVDGAGTGPRTAGSANNNSTMSEFGSGGNMNNQTRALFDMSSPVTPIGHESSQMHINASGGGLGLGTGLTSISEGGFNRTQELQRGGMMMTGHGTGPSFDHSHRGSGDGDDDDDQHTNMNMVGGRTPNSAAIGASTAGASGVSGGGSSAGAGGLDGSVSMTRGGGLPRDSIGARNVARRVSFGAGEGDLSAVSPSTTAGGPGGAGAGADMSVHSHNTDHTAVGSSSEVSPAPSGAGGMQSPEEAIPTKVPRSGNNDGTFGTAGAGGTDGGDIYDHDGNTALARGPRYLASLLTVLCAGYQLQGLYRCRDCIQVLHHLPLRHFQSAWVQHLLGKAYSECNDYKPSLLALKEMLRLEPFRLKGTELLSTVLWQLKKDKDLCALAQQVAEVDKLSPEVWCVVGNCFSLQREPEAAIKFFHRATQVDPYFTYAYTLSGHEAAHNEDFEVATSYFRKALLCDDRHYSAWYGLGSVYYHQERYALAEYHFRRALSINKASSVLHCYLGMVLRAQATPQNQKVQEALEVLTKACEAYPRNSQLRFQRAHALILQEKWEEAVAELELVRELAPKEAPVYVLLGTIYQRLRQPGLALSYFNLAMALDPKEGAALRANLEAVGRSDDDDEDDGDGSYNSHRDGEDGSQDMLSDDYEEDDMDDEHYLDAQSFSQSM